MRAGLIVTAAAMLMVSPAQACHRFSVWKYPFPQRCAVVAQVDRSWFVEITDPVPPVSARTPEQEADQRDHDNAVRAFKGSINDQMEVLKFNERANGFQGVDDK